MNGSLHIGRVAGISVRLHWTFLLLVLFLIPMFGGGWLQGLIWVALLFGSVFLHELGHSVVARSFGIRVLDITFWPIGGMARMSEIPEIPRVEGWIAIAGPLVNFILAAGAAVALMLLGLLNTGPSAFVELLNYALWVNIVLGVFNLVPAFPMDGGRILRALLARDRSWLEATEIAVRVGRTLAMGAILFSVAACVFNARGLGPVLPLIAAFVWLQGTRELMATRLRHLPQSPGLNILDSLLRFTQSGGAGTPFGPSGPFAGGSPGANPAPGASPWRGARWREPEVTVRPAEATPPPPESAPDPRYGRARKPADGFSEADIEALERFRGRLRDGRDS